MSCGSRGVARRPTHHGVNEPLVFVITAVLLCPIHTARQTRRVVSGVAV